MDKKPTTSSEKVIINPRPPQKRMTPNMIPIEPACGAAPAGAIPPEPKPEMEPAVPVDPGCEPLNNQVEGPEEGLAGVPGSEYAEQE